MEVICFLGYVYKEFRKFKMLMVDSRIFYELDMETRNISVIKRGVGVVRSGESYDKLYIGIPHSNEKKYI